MTRARMRQHEYYFIVQRKLARHYCWLELLSRPTSVMAHDRRSLYASCAFLCVSPQSRCWAVSSRPTPVLYGICVARFCASLEAAQASRVTIAARTRHATADTSTGESLTFGFS